jgi:hypothetical protein
MGSRLSPIPTLDACRTWSVLLEALSGNDSVLSAVHMIHSSIGRARRHAADGRGNRRKVLGRSRGRFLTSIHLRNTAEDLAIATAHRWKSS